MADCGGPNDNADLLNVADLVPGDILLCYKGGSTLAEWVRCLDGSCYHHALVYVGKEGALIDAAIQAIPAAVGVGFRSVSSLLLGDRRVADYVDVYRVLTDGVDTDTVVHAARNLANRRYNYAVMHPFIVLFWRQCGMLKLGRAAAPIAVRRVNEARKRFPKILSIFKKRAGRDEQLAPMTCSQLVVKCYEPWLDPVLEDVKSEIKNSPLFAARGVGRFLSIDITHVTPRHVVDGLRVLPVMPTELRDELNAFAAELRATGQDVDDSFLAMPLFVQAGMEEMAAQFESYGPGLDAPVAVRALVPSVNIEVEHFLTVQESLDRVMNRPIEFVTPGHLSRSSLTNRVGRLASHA